MKSKITRQTLWSGCGVSLCSSSEVDNTGLEPMDPNARHKHKDKDVTGYVEAWRTRQGRGEKQGKTGKAVQTDGLNQWFWSQSYDKLAGSDWLTGGSHTVGLMSRWFAGVSADQGE